MALGLKDIFETANQLYGENANFFIKIFIDTVNFLNVFPLVLHCTLHRSRKNVILFIPYLKTV